MRAPSRPIAISCILLFFCLLYWTSKSSTEALSALHHVSEKGSQIYHKISGTPYNEDDEDDFSDDDVVQPGLLEVSKLDIAYTGFKKSYPAIFPRIIWQTATEKEKMTNNEATKKWNRIQLFETKILSAADRDQFVVNHFNITPSVQSFWGQLNSTSLRDVFFRYLVMVTEGGLYTSIGNYPVIHPDRYIPIGLGAQTINTIIGLAYDGETDAQHARPILFCTDSLFSKPGHPIFEVVVQRSMSNLDFIAQTRRQELERLELDDLEQSAALGSGVLTDVVMQVLKDQGQDVTYATLHDLKTPRLFGDVLILPVSSFASPAEHYEDPESKDPGYNEVYIDWPRTRASSPLQVHSATAERHNVSATSTDAAKQTVSRRPSKNTGTS